MPIFLTVIIISYHKRKNYLRFALQSVIEQQYPREMFEIIVVKDYDDETISRYINEELKNFNIREFKTEKTNTGYKYAAGLIAAKSEIVCFLEDDDMFRHDKLVNVSQEFEKNPGLGIVKNDDIMIGPDGALLTSEFNRGIPYNITFSGIDFLKTVRPQLATKLFGGMSNLSINRTLIMQYLEILSMDNASDDFLLFLIYLLNGSSVKLLAKKITYYRISNSATRIYDNFRNYNERMITRYIGQTKVMDFLIDFLGNKSLGSFLDKIFFKKYMNNYLFDVGTRLSLKYLLIYHTKRKSFPFLLGLLYLLLSLTHDIAKQSFNYFTYVFTKLRLSHELGYMIETTLSSKIKS